MFLSQKELDLNYENDDSYPRQDIMERMFDQGVGAYFRYIFDKESRKEEADECKSDNDKEIHDALDKLAATYDFSKEEVNSKEKVDLLFMAVKRLDSNSVKVMLERYTKWDFNKHQIPYIGRTYLIGAAMCDEGYDKENPAIGSNYKCFELLLKHSNGCNINEKDRNGFDVIDALILRKKEALLDLLKKYTNVTDDIISQRRKMHEIGAKLTIAAFESDYKGLENIISDINNNKDKSGILVSDCINLLGPCQVDGEWGGKRTDYMTPLIACAYTDIGYNKLIETKCDNFRVLKLLLNDENGINLHSGHITDDVNAVGYISALTYCIIKGKSAFVKYLLSYGKDRNIDFKSELDMKHSTPLFETLVKKSWDMFSLLLKSNMFDINFDSDLRRYYTFGNDSRRNTSTILHYMADLTDDTIYNSDDVFNCKLWEMIEMVLKNDNLDINKRNSDGDSILSGFVSANKVEYVNYLIEASRNSNDNNNNDGKYSYNWKLNSISNDVNKFNENLLFTCVKHGCYDTFELLFKLKNINNSNNGEKEFSKIGSTVGGKNDNTLLHECVECHSKHCSNNVWFNCPTFQIFCLLLKECEDIDPYIKNKYGYNVLDMCKKFNTMEYLDQLNKWIQSHN